MKNKQIKKNKFPILFSALSFSFMILFIGSLIGGYFANFYAPVLNAHFGIEKTFEIVNSSGSDTDTTYYKNRFMNNGMVDKEATYKNDLKINEQVGVDGSIIFWNNNGALPLDEGNKISLFGKASTDKNYVITTQGSAHVNTDSSKITTIQNALNSRGFEINNILYSYYNSSSIGQPDNDYVQELKWDSFSSLEKSSFNRFGDVAVYVISRRAGEARDFKTTEVEGAAHIQQLTTNEKGIIENLISLKETGTFKKIVILLNTVSGSIQMDQFTPYKNDVDACVWVGSGGNSSAEQLATILSGEDSEGRQASPSGHAPDTYLFNNKSSPAYINFGNFRYTNAQDYSGSRLYNLEEHNRPYDLHFEYVVYQEGIYVGYKYYETRYEDYVMNSGKANSIVGSSDGGAWNYSEEVAYPFGYGSSYTTFSYSDYSLKENKDSYEVSVKVTNTGTYNGKDAVQVYLQKPYTEYDKETNIEQASINLVGFKKTATIPARQSEVVTIEIPKEEFKTYDSYGHKTYIVEKGSYYLTVANDAHEAVNNILAKKGYSPSTTNGRMDKDGKADFVSKVEISTTDTKSYSISTYTGAEINNQFDSADLTLMDQYDNSCDITYLSRKDWEGTWPQPVQLNINDAMYDALDYVADEEAVLADKSGEMPVYGKDNGLNLMMAYKDDEGEWIPYDDPIWEDLLDQTTQEEQFELYQNGWAATIPLTSINAPGTVSCDGPLGITWPFDNAPRGLGMAYCDEGLQAATFDRALIEELGKCIGDDMLATGYQLIYGPGANIHRTTFGGRNAEYYSEDGMLSGLICEASVKGIQYNGSAAQLKHFALNDQETNRQGVATFANEQSIREIYLKSFEYGLAKGRGEALSVMNGFNRIGELWCGGHKGLGTNVLRGEWGFIGWNQSDGAGNPFMSRINGLMAGTDIFMNPRPEGDSDEFKANPTICQAIREATHRILYTTLRTSAINGLDSNSRIKRLTPWWSTGITIIEIALGAAMVSFMGLTGWGIYKYFRNKKSLVLQTDIGPISIEDSMENVEIKEEVKETLPIEETKPSVRDDKFYAKQKKEFTKLLNRVETLMKDFEKFKDEFFKD